jgi:hypothetical protein
VQTPKLGAQNEYKIEIGYDKISSIPFKADFERKVSYILFNGRLKALECFSTFEQTLINTSDAGHIPGENMIIQDQSEISDELKLFDEEIIDTSHRPESKNLKLIQIENYHFGQYQNEIYAFYEDGDIGFIDN